MKPTLPGYQIDQLIGEGVCGPVWAAEDPVGNQVAIRALSTLSVNLEHIRESVRRLATVKSEGHGPMPIWLQALDLRPAMLVTPLIGRKEGDLYLPATVQTSLGIYLGTEKAGELIQKLSQALAVFHRHRVVHGNLKPGNLFLGDGGRLLVADYAMGWMPGLDVLGFTDAILYMSPEQLRNPAGVLSEEGYQWDVFAFGVMAYRLLEGAFPRCSQSFEDVAPPPGLSHVEGIEADFAGVAEQLVQEEIRPWQRQHDPILMAVIERCLQLNPADRFRDMVELCDYWEKESILARHSSEMEVVGKKLRRTRAVKKSLGVGLAAAVAVAAGLGGSWAWREVILAQRTSNYQLEKRAAEEAKDRAEELQSQAETAKQESDEMLTKTRDKVKLLSQGRETLINWALREGGGELPVLLGRAERLEVLAEDYERLLESDRLAGNAELRKQWETEAALLAVARGETREARARLQGEVARLGACGLAELLLRESRTSPLNEKELALARALAMREGGAAEPWLGVVLDLAEARSVELSEGPESALRIFAGMLPKFEHLRAIEPGAGILWRTRVRSEAATMADGAGDDRLARLFREQVVEELRNLLGAEGLTDEMKRELKEAFVIAAAGLAEADYGAGHLVAAYNLADEAISLLKVTRRGEARISLAVNYAVLAGCERERSHTKVAQAHLRDSLALLAEPVEDELERLRTYREGMFRWQMGIVQAQLGDLTGEQELIEEGYELLVSLLDDEKSVRPTILQVHHVLGYLCVDLADSVEKEERRIAALDRAIESWRFLLEADPEDSEYLEGLAWTEAKKGHR
ncbi:MAG: hypothetical protein Q7Q71_14880 [Verrucomicrobiota bacterium JB023]|nr:hypothetical protein [Verrucomicrobiota bacterium JB023]